jgi:MFS family permease
MLGALLGSLTVTYKLGLNTHFWAIALINLALIPTFYFFLLPDEKRSQNDHTNSSILSLDKYLITLALIAFCGMLCEGAMADWITLYFKENITSHIFPQTIGFTSFASAMVVGRLAGDYLSNKFNVKKILVVNGLLISIGIFITIYSPFEFVKILGCFIAGLGISTIVPLIYSKAGTQEKIQPSIAIAGVSTIAYIGFLIGPVVIGYLADLFSLQHALILLIILGLTGSLIAKTLLPNSAK